MHANPVRARFVERKLLERLSAVLGTVHIRAEHVDDLVVVGINPQIAVVHGTGIEIVDLGPRTSPVFRPEHTAAFRLHRGHDHVGS